MGMTFMGLLGPKTPSKRYESAVVNLLAEDVPLDEAERRAEHDDPEGAAAFREEYERSVRERQRMTKLKREGRDPLRPGMGNSHAPVFNATAGGPKSGTVDPIASFELAVRSKIAAGFSKRAATRAVILESPRLHSQYLEAYNQRARNNQPPHLQRPQTAAAAAPAGGGDAVTEFENAVAAKQSTGLSKSEATRAVVRENPELHARFLETYNARGGQRHVARRESNLTAPDVGGVPASTSSPRAAGDAIGAYNNAVHSIMQQRGCARYEAARVVNSERPDLREAFVAAHNAKHGRGLDPAYLRNHNL